MRLSRFQAFPSLQQDRTPLGPAVDCTRLKGLGSTSDAGIEARRRRPTPNPNPDPNPDPKRGIGAPQTACKEECRPNPRAHRRSISSVFVIVHKSGPETSQSSAAPAASIPLPPLFWAVEHDLPRANHGLPPATTRTTSE